MTGPNQQEHKQHPAPEQKPDQSISASSRDMQGEGNYDAARRHRESTQDFIAKGKVEQAAKDAAPDSAAEAQALKAAEQAGRQPAKN